MSCFKEWGSQGSTFTSGTTLSKCIITHPKDFSFFVKEQNVINTASNLLNLTKIFDLHRRIFDH